MRVKIKNLPKDKNFVDVGMYMKNPVVLLQHNYQDVEAIIGKTEALHIFGSFAEIKLNTKLRRYKEIQKLIENDAVEWECGYLKKGKEMLELQEISLILKEAK